MDDSSHHATIDDTEIPRLKIQFPSATKMRQLLNNDNLQQQGKAVWIISRITNSVITFTLPHVNNNTFMHSCTCMH